MMVGNRMQKAKLPYPLSMIVKIGCWSVIKGTSRTLCIPVWICRRGGPSPSTLITYTCLPARWCRLQSWTIAAFTLPGTPSLSAPAGSSTLSFSRCLETRQNPFIVAVPDTCCWAICILSTTPGTIGHISRTTLEGPYHSWGSCWKTVEYVILYNPLGCLGEYCLEFQVGNWWKISLSEGP